MSTKKPTIPSSVPPRIPFTEAEGGQQSRIPFTEAEGQGQFRAALKEVRASPGVPIDEFPSDPSVACGDRRESAILKGETHQAAQDVARVLGKAFGPDAEQGRKVRAGRMEARKKRANMLRKLRKENTETYQATVEALHKKHPHLSYNSICELAGPLHDVAPKTIKRYTENPRKPSPR